LAAAGEEMTHDELLTKINSLPEVIGLAEFKARHDALRAVVELHEPYGDIMCVICEGISYPCSTVKAIEKEFSNG
jgi:hypothetical protein